MSSERKGELIRGGISLGLGVAAVAAALWLAFPDFGFGRKRVADADPAAEALDAARLEQIKNQKDCLAVVHLEHPAHADSGKSRAVFREVDLEKYGGHVRYVHVDVKRHPALASVEGVNAGDPPQLVFYFEGTRVGNYHGPWTKPEVERKIEEVYRGCMERVGKDWLPEVKGMQRERGPAVAPGQPTKSQR